MQPIWSATTPDKTTTAGLAKSLVQKCIRRGRESDAVYFAKQLYLGRKKRIHGCDIWKRLIIISVEDIGVADILMPLRIEDLAWDAFNLRKIVEAVVHLARAPKCRAVDLAIHWFDKYGLLDGDTIREDYVPPTIGLQECIRGGQEADAVFCVKRDYGCKQQLCEQLFTCAQDVGDALMPLWIEDLERLAKRIDNHEPKHNPDLMMFVHAAMLLCRAQKSGDHWFYKGMNYVPPTADELDRYMDENQPKPDSEDFAIVLDDAKDKHTAEGHNMGRTGKVGEQHFWARGCILENRSDVADFQAPADVPPTNSEDEYIVGSPNRP
jgi:hypothetical protein